MGQSFWQGGRDIGTISTHGWGTQGSMQHPALPRLFVSSLSHGKKGWCKDDATADLDQKRTVELRAKHVMLLLVCQRQFEAKCSNPTQ